jgi:hypothetical protein
MQLNCTLKKILVINSLLVGLLLPGQAQTLLIKGYVKDALSEEHIPFASVSLIKSGAGKLTDSAGNFAFRVNEWPLNDTLWITYVGYQDYKLALTAPLLQKAESVKKLELVVSLVHGKITEEVVVKRKIDRGYLMWKRIVKNKSKNDRFRFKNFSYELYNKLELDLNRLNKDKMKEMGLLKPFGFLFDNVDSTEGAPFLPVYLTESISDYYFQKNPLRTREIIKGSKTEGVNNESVSRLLGGTEQNINLYANFIPVFDKEFIGPLSDNGDAYYKYQVLDTQVVNSQRLIHFTFTPKRKGENTFEGDGWVHDPSWAVQKITLFLSKEANINFVDKLSLIQEYKLINDSTWFLVKDKFVVDIAPIGKTRFGVIARKTTTYRNVVYNSITVEDNIKKNKIAQEVVLATGARQQADDFWSKERPEALSKNEKAIYSMIDTLQKMPLFRKYTNTLNFIATGYLNSGNYQIGPWQNWVSGNQLEGIRLRWDLGTNAGFNKNLILHGYVAYGTTDKRFKYEADALYLFSRNPRSYIFARYSKDLDYGQQYADEVSQDNVFALAIRKKGVPIKFLFTEEIRLDFFKEWHSGFSVTLSAADRRYNPLLNLPPKNLFPNDGLKAMNNFEASVKLRFAYLEKFLETTFYRSSLGSPYPIVEIKYSKGISGVLKSGYSYNKISGTISDFLKIPPYGNLYFNIFTGKTMGTLPYMLLDVAPGNEIYYYNRQAYNLMNRWEYIHDQYIGMNAEHNIGNGLFRFIPLTRKLKFRQFYTLKGLWGSLSEANRQYNDKPGYTFQSLNGNTYLELGTGVDNIFKVFRMDFVWRLAPRPLPIEKNKSFGAFFSFRLAF